MSPTSYRTAPPRIITVSIHPSRSEVKGACEIGDILDLRLSSVSSLEMHFLIAPTCLEVIDLRGMRHRMKARQIHQERHRHRPPEPGLQGSSDYFGRHGIQCRNHFISALPEY